MQEEQVVIIHVHDVYDKNWHVRIQKILSARNSVPQIIILISSFIYNEDSLVPAY